jgi:lipoate-protein ligase A
MSCPLVRRSSGGGAILHDRELTYSIAIAHGNPGSFTARQLYDVVHDTLIVALAEFSIEAKVYGSKAADCTAPGHEQVSDQPFLCFQRRSCTDIVCAQVKIVGSAQRRRRGAVLQHGSILLRRSAFAPELPGIFEVTGKSVEPSELIRRWPPRLAERIRLDPRAEELSPPEIARAQALEASRFASAEHLGRR